jgi:hypothetical protein
LVSNPTLKGKLVLVEICGGAGGLTRMASRYHLAGGRNFDLVANFDLLQPNAERLVLDYLWQNRPEVLVAAPPCTAFGSWSFLNSWKHPLSHQRTLMVGVRIASLSCQACRQQLLLNLDCFVENPQKSRLWLLNCFVKLCADYELFWALLDQCMTGLADPDGELTRKGT